MEASGFYWLRHEHPAMSPDHLSNCALLMWVFQVFASCEKPEKNIHELSVSLVQVVDSRLVLGHFVHGQYVEKTKQHDDT